MRVALITNYLTGYRLPLYERLAPRLGLEVLCFGGAARYVPAWFADLDAQLTDAPFPARRVSGPGELLTLGRSYDAVITGFLGGATLFAAYAGAKRFRTPFVLWASIWAQPRSAMHLLALPASRHVYRHADAVIAYGTHAARFVAPFRRNPDEIVIAPQSVEADLFGRTVVPAEIAAFRARHALPADGPLVLYSGRLVPEKGIAVLLDAWSRLSPGAPGAPATLVLAGDGPLADRARHADRVALLGPVAREELPVAYAAAAFTVLAAIPTPLFREPWGLVCNEAFHQARPVIATTSVGAVAGGLVRDGVNGVVVPPGDAPALATAIARLLRDPADAARLGAAGREAVAAYTYDAMADAFATAVARATGTPC